jgi:hypothetical protein
MAPQPPTIPPPGSSPSSTGGGDGWLGTATKVAGLLAGAVALVYLLGGVVIALRLLFDGFSAPGVVSLLAEVSRELVISTAMIEVIGPAGTVGLIAALAYGILGPSTPSSRASRRAREGGLRWPFLLAFALLALLLTLPALLAALRTEVISLLVAAILLSAFIVFGLLVIGWRHIRGTTGGLRSLPARALTVGVAFAAMAVVPAVLISAAWLEFEEVQVCTTDSADRGEGILLGSASDRVLVAIDVRGEESILSYPTERVTKTEYGDLSSEFACRPESAEAVWEAAAATAALGGHGSEVEERLAGELRPWLQFDSTERWRPLSVEAFVAEEFDDGRHGICRRDERPPCERDLADSKRLRRGVAYVDVHGDGRNGKGIEAPEADCAMPHAAVDCDDGAGSAIYYRRTSNGNRWYWDYWWFYRYSDYTGKVNNCEFICGDHEGDWEGMTVITTASTEPKVLGAIYASHSARIKVDAAILPLVGKRPRAFVAEGTHATYPFACTETCGQYSTLGLLTLEVGLYEESHDGVAGWSHNSDESCEEADCVRPLPEGGGGEEGDSLPIAGEWAAWRGKWGATCPDGCPGGLDHRESSPQSPGNQSRYRCPWIPTVRAAPQIGGRGRLTTRPVGDKERLLAACEARRGGL